MMRIVKLKNESNVFVTCEEKNYYKKIFQKLETLSKNQITPAILELSPYKIHVSLAAEEYKKHRTKIIKIIDQHILNNSVIFSYKFVSNKNLENQINEEKELLALVLTYKNNLENNSENIIFDTNWEAKLIDRLKNYFELDDLPDMKKETNEIITNLEVSIKTDQRFIDGEQFTLYIPENFNKYKIVNLCQRINDYLLKKKVKPGMIADIESSLGAYLNFRQEFLLDDHNEMNKTGNLDMEKRIHPIQLSDDDLEIERRKCVIEEQENSELYQYIKSQLKTDYNKQHFYFFRSNANLPKKEKKQKEISYINPSIQSLSRF